MTSIKVFILLLIDETTALILMLLGITTYRTSEIP